MEHVTVRTATAADLPIMLGFEQGVITAERPFDVTLKDGHINYYDLEQMITAPNVEIVVAMLGSEIIGSGYVRIETSKVYLQHEKHGFMGFMFVKPEHRGKGVNNKIIETLKQWCKAQNITEFRLQVYNDNLPAIKAYEKVGFEKLMIEMRAKI